MFKPLFCFLVCLLPTIGFGQTLSHSLAQCSALAFAGANWTNDPDRIVELEATSEQWFDRAIDRARQDDISQPFETLTNVANLAESAWLSRGRTALFSGQYREWVAYCSRLAEDQGLDFRLP